MQPVTTRPERPSEIRWTVLDRFSNKQVAEITAPDRASAEREAQRRGYSLQSHTVTSVLEFLTFRGEEKKPISPWARKAR